MHQENGSSLSLGEQLRWRKQPAILCAVHSKQRVWLAFLMQHMLVKCRLHIRTDVKMFVLWLWASALKGDLLFKCPVRWEQTVTLRKGFRKNCFSFVRRKKNKFFIWGYEANLIICLYWRTATLFCICRCTLRLSLCMPSVSVDSTSSPALKSSGTVSHQSGNDASSESLSGGCFAVRCQV